MPVIFQNDKRYSPVISDDIKALPTVGTASGSVATFDTDLTENLVECVCDIQYSQASGTPSPDNPLPITVYNALNLSHSGADTSNPTITNIPFGQTVAKGTLDVLSGVLTIESGAKKLLEFAGYFGGANNGFCAYITDNDVTSTTINTSLMTSNCFTYYNAARLNAPLYSYGTVGGSDNQYWFILPNTITNKNEANDWLNNLGIDVYFTYKPSTTTIQLNSNQVQALLNENNIWHDCGGDTSVKYLLSVGKKIS